MSARGNVSSRPAPRAQNAGRPGSCDHALHHGVAILAQSDAQAAQLLAADAQLNVEELREILKDIVSADKHAGQIIQHLRSLLMRGELHIQSVEIADVIRRAEAGGGAGFGTFWT